MTSHELVPYKPAGSNRGGPQRDNDQAEPDMTIEQAFRWFESLKLTGCKPATIGYYKAEHRRLNRFLGRDATIRDIDDATIGAVMRWMADDGLAPATINKARASWKAFGDFLARQGVCRSIEIGRVREIDRIPTAYTAEEISRLIAHCDSPACMVNGIQEGPFFRALILAIYCCGERIGAMTKARWDDLRDNVMVVRGENRKGGRADMAHRLSDEALAAVEAIRQPQRVFIFDLPFSTQTLTNRLDKLCERAGLDVQPRNKWHRIRRTCATLTDLHGGDATRVLGHSSPGLARKTYIDPRISKPPAAADVLPDVGGGNTGPMPAPTNGTPESAEPTTTDATSTTDDCEVFAWV